MTPDPPSDTHTHTHTQHPFPKLPENPHFGSIFSSISLQYRPDDLITNSW